MQWISQRQNIFGLCQNIDNKKAEILASRDYLSNCSQRALLHSKHQPTIMLINFHKTTSWLWQEFTNSLGYVFSVENNQIPALRWIFLKYWNHILGHRYVITHGLLYRQALNASLERQLITLWKLSFNEWRSGSGNSFHGRPRTQIKRQTVVCLI